MKGFQSLVRLELVNLFGLNTYRYTKDPKEKKKKLALLIALGFVGVVLMGYAGVTAYALADFGLADKIPMLFALLAFVLQLGLGAMKAKSLIYREKDLELLTALPIRGTQVAAARMVRLYVDGLILTTLVMLPSMILCGIYTDAGALFYVGILPALLILPILPVAISAWVGILFAAIISRFRHKVLAEVILVVIMMVGMFAVAAATSTNTMTVGTGSKVSSVESTETAEKTTEKLSEEEKEKQKSADAASEGKKAETDSAAAAQPGDKTEGYSIVRTIPSSLYIVPELTASNKRLQKKCSMLNEYADETITYVFGSVTETLDFKDFMNWIKIKGDEVTLRQEKVTEYVSGLAEKYNTRYRDRVFTTSGGGEVTFPAGLNEYGYTILEESEAAQLTQDILSGQSVEREPIYLTNNDWGDPCYLSRNGQDDLNGTYVEVSIGAQHMWYYLNGALFLESDVVTGDVTLDQGTASGVFPLAFKESPATLKGGEGKKKYTTKVQYWMPFYEGQGLHDAWWKTVFGGEEYKGNGSHGCVNLPSSVAETLYNNIVPGTPIVIYN